jgi:hypothetical protein
MNLLKSIFGTPTVSVALITATSAADISSLAVGFYKFEYKTGKWSIGYKWTSSYKLDVGHGKFIVDGGLRIPIPEKPDGLPVVKWNFKGAAAGVQTVGGVNIMDTDSLEEFDGNVKYEQYRGEKHRPIGDKLNNGLWGGGR